MEETNSVGGAPTPAFQFGVGGARHKVRCRQPRNYTALELGSWGLVLLEGGEWKVVLLQRLGCVSSTCPGALGP